MPRIDVIFFRLLDVSEQDATVRRIEPRVVALREDVEWTHGDGGAC